MHFKHHTVEYLESLVGIKRHLAPYGLLSSAFNQTQVTEENIISDEITNKGNERNCFQPIGNFESYYDDMDSYSLYYYGLIQKSFDSLG
ncbi:43408_t:CDS:2 [Gigaspora margarita]|uniref:43408_t:CDS:1 n=1 Tax=Gigaspora margarita TaxID=4874 RepID=A0ABN7VSP9_GIGMA|nr:43408_t:CDS:2 [Gigaspora margarita]